MKEKQTGWKFLVALDGRRVLVLDTTLGTISLSLAQNFDEVYTFHFDKKSLLCIEERVKEEGLSNIFCISIEDACNLPFSEGFFDAVVLHNVEEILPFLGMENKGNGADYFQKFLKETTRVLTSEGLLFLSSRNKYGYDFMINKLTRRRKDDLREKRILPLLPIEGLLRKAKFNDRRVYSFYPSFSKAQEIIGFGSSVCNGNVTLKEYSKSKIFNSRLFKYFSPAFAIVASKNNRGVNFTERLLSDLQEKNILPSISPNKFSLKRYLILIDKVILTIGRGKKATPDLIIKLPLSSDSLARCKYEKKILEDLKRKDIEISRKIPIFHYGGKLCGQPFFVFSAIKGVSLDLPIAKMNRIISNASDTLIEFHRDTSYETLIDEIKFQEIFISPIDKLSQLLGEGNLRELNYIGDYLKDKLLGKKMNLVWEHGDFSHENVLVDPKTLEVLGVIDWEMSKEKGLPLLDLLYTLTRKEMLFRGEEFSKVFIEKILPLQLSYSEKDILNRYLRKIAVSKDILLPLLIMFWINHIVYRDEIHGYSKSVEENLHKVIPFIRQSIKDRGCLIDEYISAF